MPTQPPPSPGTPTRVSFTDVFDIPADKQPCYLVVNRDGLTHDYLDLQDALTAVRQGPDRKLYAAWELPKLMMYLQVGFNTLRRNDPTVHAVLTMVEGQLHPLYALYALSKAQTNNLASAMKLALEAMETRIAPTLKMLFDKGPVEENKKDPVPE